MAKNINIYQNSLRSISVDDTVTTWGELKSRLISDYGYTENITGVISKTGLELDKPETPLPEGEGYTINLITVKSKYGN